MPAKSASKRHPARCSNSIKSSGGAEKERIRREFCAWETVEIPSVQKEACFYVRGDLKGELDYDTNGHRFVGFFEFPAKGHEQGFYELVRRQKNGREKVLQHTEVQYDFDASYFSPRWENVAAVNRFIAASYQPAAALESIYRYEKFERDIQMLVLTDQAVPECDKQVVLITGRVHNPESGMTAACYRFVKWLLHDGREYLRHYLFLIIPMTIPLTFEEDPRSHNVNRLWQPEISAPDLVAIRDRVIDRYLPEIWVDCHSFNDILPLHEPCEQRRRCGDYVVAHPVGETFFDHPYSTEIALKMIAAAEQAGHKHRNEEFFQWWADYIAQIVPCRPGEKFVTEHHSAGIFSGIDYARYADRGKFGVNGRDWPAMACDYGYYRCHSVNLCLECKPLHVGAENGAVVHYAPTFPDSHVVKLQEICRIGREHFRGQPFSGFPCNIIAADANAAPASVMLCAWGMDRREIRESRTVLWRNRHSICLHRAANANEVTVECFAAIESAAALRIAAEPGCTFQVAGVRVQPAVKDGFVFVPFVIRLGRITVAWNIAPLGHGSDTYSQARLIK